MKISSEEVLVDAYFTTLQHELAERFECFHASREQDLEFLFDLETSVIMPLAFTAVEVIFKLRETRISPPVGGRVDLSHCTSYSINSSIYPMRFEPPASLSKISERLKNRLCEALPSSLFLSHSLQHFLKQS